MGIARVLYNKIGAKINPATAYGQPLTAFRESLGAEVS